MVGVLTSIYLVLVALLAGSFFNLAADRLPRGESVVRPRSHCRTCGRRLDFVDLLPVAGYAIRQGRCASCGAAIGVVSPIVEALAGLSMAIPLAVLGPAAGGVAGGGLVILVGAVVVALAFSRSRAAESRTR